MSTTGAKFRFKEDARTLFESAVEGKKTVETRAAEPKYLGIKKGDKIVLVCGKSHFSTSVTKISRFKDAKSLLKAYPVKRINPFLKSAKELEAMYYSYPNYKEIIRKYGMIAFELEKRSKKQIK